MLQRVTLQGVQLPRLYMAENQADAQLAQEKGIPYIIWKHSMDDLLKHLLRPILEEMFPGIMWNKVLGRRRKLSTVFVTSESTDDAAQENADILKERTVYPVVEEEIEDQVNQILDIETEKFESDPYEDEIEVCADGTTEARYFSDTGAKEEAHTSVQEIDLFDYMGDLSSSVNLEVLQKLSLMPSFVGDIMDCIKRNLNARNVWAEGYNKKLRYPAGNFSNSRELPNLIILDVSGSIPRGISATMLTLIDTLRTQLDADLIITSTMSRYYPAGSELPNPDRLREQFGFGNESHDFFNILTKHVQGKRFGHVISFGDNDTPAYKEFEQNQEYSLLGTTVEKVHHFHTGCHYWGCGTPGQRRTGYAKWCHMLAKEPEVEFDESWCNVIRKDW